MKMDLVDLCVVYSLALARRIIILLEDMDRVKLFPRKLLAISKSVTRKVLSLLLVQLHRIVNLASFRNKLKIFGVEDS